MPVCASVVDHSRFIYVYINFFHCGAFGYFARLDDMTYLSDCKKSVLMEMKQAYRQENQTPLLLQPSHHSTPLLPSSLPLSRAGSSECVSTSREDLGSSEGR